MAITAENSGTQTTTVTTEHTVEQTNVAGVFVFEVDLNAMADGDVVELRIYKMLLTAGTSRILHYTAYYGAQPTYDKIKTSIPVMNELTDSTALQFSILQSFGSSRSIPWKVLKVA